MSDHAIYVAALGASTPLGRDAWSSAAAVRAGLSAFSRHPFMVDTAGAPMQVAVAPWLDLALEGLGRLEALVRPAIDQALEPLAGEPGLRLAISLGLPGSRPGLEADLAAELQAVLRDRYAPLAREVAVFTSGHAAGLQALESAFEHLRRDAADACVVAGVDSYLMPETLEWLEACDQLHGAGPLNNAWGFIPGEGAGAVLLVRSAIAKRLRLPPLARVLGVGSATEQKRIKTPTVCIGEGLTTAFRAALSALPSGVRVSDVYCDMNGEPYRADEFGFAVLRTKEAFVSASDFVAPADCWGDVAAAGGPLHLVLACVAGAKSYARGPVTLAWASGEGGERSAALLAVRSGLEA
jgi:3-oxoacyl-[acyl-carrier-protein] synthase-1